MNLATVEIKAFVPARDFERSKAFYQAIGFAMPWSDDDLAYLNAGDCSFLLQRFHVDDHARNFQMHLLVDNVDDWHAHVVAQDIGTRFGVDIGEPEDRPWAMRDFTLTDPSGVLWRIAQNIPASI
ncbi:MAG: VOC family protein [Dokdonella sp.]|uniref:VOC family protein n=1 Tax=Dokdonella sp. TaxID=2291710 RepID=UPI0032635BCD